MANTPAFDLPAYVLRKQTLPLPFTGARYADLKVSETPASPTEKYGNMHGRATRTFRTKSYAGRWDLCAYLLGWSSAQYTDAGAFLCIRRVLPDAYAPTVRPISVQRYQHSQVNDFGETVKAGGISTDDQLRPWLWGTDISRVRGVGRQKKTILPGLDPGLGSFSSYDEAEVEATYEAKHYRLTSDEDLHTHGFTRVIGNFAYPDEMYCARYCSFHPQPQVLAMFVPQDGLKWGADAPAQLAGQRAFGDTPRRKVSIDVQLQWYGVPGLPRGLRSQLGTLNDREWEIHPPGIVRKFEAHTLIYLGFRLNSYRQVTGDFVHDISLLFSHFEEGHNKDLCFPPGGNYRWTTVTTPGFDASSDYYLKNLIYQESDFSNLFRLDDLV